MALRPWQPRLALTAPPWPPAACGPGPLCSTAWALLPALARPEDASLQHHWCPALAWAPVHHHEPSWGPGLGLSLAAMLGPALLPHSVQWGCAQQDPLSSRLPSCVRWTAGRGHSSKNKCWGSRNGGDVHFWGISCMPAWCIRLRERLPEQQVPAPFRFAMLSALFSHHTQFILYWRLSQV